MGALSGAATAGIGQAFGAVGGIGKELGRASAHALSSGGISRLGGGDFWSGAASGAVGSITGSLFHNVKPHWQIGSSAISGGISSELMGGNFWQGAAQGGIIAAANHVYHRHLRKAGPPWEYNGQLYDNKTDLYMAILVDMAADQFGIKDIAALGGVIAGQPILKKRFRIPGSSRGTSPLSKSLSKLPGKFPGKRLPTVVDYPKALGGKGMRIAFTKSIGRFAGRAIPIVGWGVLAYDVGRTFYRTHITYHRILNQ